MQTLEHLSLPKKICRLKLLKEYIDLLMVMLEHKFRFLRLKILNKFNQKEMHLNGHMKIKSQKQVEKFINQLQEIYTPFMMKKLQI